MLHYERRLNTLSRTWLKEIREKNGINQQQLAEIVGISREYITMIENGQRTPSVNVAKKIAEIFDIEWTIFFEN